MRRQRSDALVSPRDAVILAARSNATQAITLECVKWRRAAAYFPNPFVGLAPGRFEMFENDRAEIQGAFGRRQATAQRLEHRVGNFAVYVELKLCGRGVADADRARTFISRQPGDFPFGQELFAGDAIQDLDLCGAASDRPKQPVAPSPGLVVIAEIHEGEQGEGGVAQPAIAIV